MRRVHVFGKLATSLSGSNADRLVLAVLNFLAAYVSWGYDGLFIPFPEGFAALHLVAGSFMAASFNYRLLTPYALALSAGVFVGRSLGIWTSIWFGNTGQFPVPTLLLAGVQWAALAWVIRPTSLHGSLYALADELDIKVK